MNRPNEVRSLGDMCYSHLSDKASHGYAKIYEKFFEENRFNNINFVEIGVYEGSSAKVWREYFTQADIFMLDIFDKEQLLKNVDVNFMKVDAGSETDLEKVLDAIESKTQRREIDILVDDGSHFQHDQMKSLGFLYPFISKGGYYVIEDICREERLATGSQWWGNSKESRGKWNDWGGYKSVRTDEEWMAGKEMDLSASTDATIKKFIEKNIFDSKFLTSEQNKYITENVKKIYYYSEELSCLSKLAVFSK